MISLEFEWFIKMPQITTLQIISPIFGNGSGCSRKK